jgi:processing peptidase subunit beta
MVICGVGAVDHDELVSISQKYWGSLPVAPRTSYPTNFDPAVFGGGEVRQANAELTECHVSVAFEGTSWTDDEAYALMIIQSMLGTWDRLSGAGAKVPSPLAAALAEGELCHSFNTLNISYKDTGLFGIYLIGDQETMPKALEAVAANVQRFGEPGAVGADELARAKTQLKASLMQQLSTFSFVAEDIGRQILTYGRRVPPVETFARIDAVTLDDIRAAAQRRFQGKSVAVAALGAIDQLPDYEWINGLLK